MNEDVFIGKWSQIKGKVKEKWGKLTDNDLTRINGKRDQLLGFLQERYGWEEEHAEEELKRFEDSMRNESRGPKREFRSEEPYRGEQKDQDKNRWSREDEEGEGKNKRRKIG